MNKCFCLREGISLAACLKYSARKTLNQGKQSTFLKTLGGVKRTSFLPFRLVETRITMTRPSGWLLKQDTVRCC